MPLLVGAASVPQRCMFGHETPAVSLLPAEKIFPITHERMDYGIMRIGEKTLMRCDIRIGKRF